MRSLYAWAISRSRLLASVILLALGLMAAAALYVYLSYQQATADLLMQRDQQLTYLSAARLKDELASFSGELLSLARSDEIAHGTPASQQAALEAARHRLAVFDAGVILLDGFGKTVTSYPARPDAKGADWSDRDYFRALLQSGTAGVISNAVMDGPDGAPVIVMAVPIQGTKGDFAGALAGMFRLGDPKVSSFYASIVRLRLGQSGNTYVVDGAGSVLYDSGFKLVMQPFGQMSLASIGSSSDGRAVRMRDEEGNDVVTARAAVPGTDWMLVSEDDWRTLTASSSRYSGIMLGLIIGGMILPALGVVLLARQHEVQSKQAETRLVRGQLARLVQAELMPKHRPGLPGWEVDFEHRRAGDGCGGYLDYVFLPDGRLMFAIGRIDARGLPAAVNMATNRAALRSVARQMLPPAQALTQANQVITPELAVGVSVSCLYLVLDPASGRVEFANAGHSVPYIVAGQRALEVGTAGPALGVSLEAAYEQEELTIQPGERLVIYSSSLTDGQNGQGESFGPERLLATLEAARNEGRCLSDLAFSQFDRFAESHAMVDEDAMLLALHRLQLL